MRNTVAALVFSTMLAASPARANDLIASDDKKMDSVAAETSRGAAVDGPAAKDDDVPPPLKLRPAPGSLAGVSVLRSLHVSLGIFQAYDVYSTTKAIKNGAVEQNPLMRGAVGNQALFIGLKAAMTAGPIYQAEKLWRNHHRIGAIALMAASNGIMIGVAAHNASVIRKAQASQAVR